MIKLNLKNAVTEKAIEKLAPKVKRIADEMETKSLPGWQFMGWTKLHETEKALVKDIQAEAKRLIREKVDLLVVIGIGGSFAGAKAAIEMVQGEFPITRKMEVMFVGESVSSTNLAQKLAYAQGRNFAINVISKSGTTLEPSISFRLFRRILEENVGVDHAKRFIIATTDANNGTLLNMALRKEYKRFVIPDNVGGRFSVLTPVGLFPIACAGLDIAKMLKGAETANKKFSIPTLEGNDAYRYAVARHLLNKKFPVELMVQYEPQMKAFSEWWKQLAGESEGKDGKGLFPSSAVFSTDLHSLGQFIQDGTKVLFETVLTVKTPDKDVVIFESHENLDTINYLTKHTVHDINNTVFRATTDAHVKKGKVPNIHIEFEAFTEESFGQLVVFFERAVAMTAYLEGVNPFNQPGVEVYKTNLKVELK